ncbi:MAG: NAD(+) synthase [Rikenellaceae bacterium]|nr:NAD(+) synthase [Rikenellaceae bacterium]
MEKKREMIEFIVGWMKEYARQSGTSGFVVGVSGGIDSAVVSTLAARTGLRTVCVSMPIHQAETQVHRAQEHLDWLKERFREVETMEIDLTDSYERLIGGLPVTGLQERQGLTLANTRSRLRMVTLYYLAGIYGLLVAGAGNKIEDFGVGFFTKYGDGGVDLSPIADLTKTQVYALAEELEIVPSIRTAPPTDGLFGDDRSDEDQIGASYPELEWAMEQAENGALAEDFTGRQREVFDIYLHRNRANRHKMEPVPVCKIPEELFR